MTRAEEQAAQAVYEMAVRGRRDFREAYRCALMDNRRLRAALERVRVRAIPAGAAVALRSEDWEARCIEVLDIIDDALATPGAEGG